MKQYFAKWNFLRILRLLLGLFVLIQGIVMLEYFTILMGLLLAAMPLLNLGCCAGGSCDASYNRRNHESGTEEVSYTEIK